MKVEHQKLVDELYHNAEVSNKPLEQRLADLSIWFFSNKDDIPKLDAGSRALFLEKAVWVLIEIAALQAERLHELEGKGTGSILWTPSGLRMTGDVKKFG